MSQRLIATAAFAVCFGWFAASLAHGQAGRRAPIDRPSVGPSARLGFVGGVYTRQYNVGALGEGGSPAGPSGLPAPNFFGAAGGLARMPPAPIPQALTFAQVGYLPGSGSPMSGSWEGVSSAQLARVSRLQGSQSLTAPLTGVGPFHLMFPERPFYAPVPEGGAVHEFFGLTPTHMEHSAWAPAPGENLVTLLELENQRLLYELRARALRAFKRAMSKEGDDRGELLSAAQRELETVRDLEPQASVPCLLLVHTALEKGQVLQAIRYLVDAARRSPSVFVDQPDIASYYGDAERLADQQRWYSGLLERQMRQYLRIGDENPGNPSTYVLQAYCAWILGDRARVKNALDRLMAVEDGAAVSAEIIAVGYALAGAAR